MLRQYVALKIKLVDNALRRNRAAWSSVYPKSSMVIANALGMSGICISIRLGTQITLSSIRESKTEPVLIFRFAYHGQQRDCEAVNGYLP